jgi:carbon-monoxide dehydrogenase medium subunit
MVAVSKRGQRVIAADRFFEGIMTTVLADDEILTEVRLPVISDETRFGFYEFNRRAGDFAIAMALVTYRLAGGVIAEPRVGIGGAETHPRRIAEAEAALNGRPPEPKAFQAAAEAAAQAVDPMEDIQADAEYRRDLVRAVTRRALEQSAR